MAFPVNDAVTHQSFSLFAGDAADTVVIVVKQIESQGGYREGQTASFGQPESHRTLLQRILKG